MYLEDLRKSVFTLAKYNNGKFKTEKQKEFLTKVLKRNHGYLGDISTYGNITSFFAEWDGEGITKITKQHKKSGKEFVNFKRKSESEHQKEVEKRLFSEQKYYEEQRDWWNNAVKETLDDLKKKVKTLEGVIKDNPTEPLFKNMYDEYSEKLDLHEKELDYLPKEMPSWWKYDKERRKLYTLGIETGLEKRIYRQKDEVNENFKVKKIYINENKINSSIFAKNAAEKIISILKTLFRKNNYRRYVDIRQHGKMKIDFKDSIISSLSFEVNPRNAPFNKIFDYYFPSLEVVYDDKMIGSENAGTISVVNDRYYKLKINTRGFLGDILHEKDYKNLFKLFELKRGTLIHELAHFYDVVQNRIAYVEKMGKKRQGQKGDQYLSKDVDNRDKVYFYQRDENFAFVSQVFNDVLNHIEENFEYILKDTKFLKVASKKEVKEIFKLERDELLKVFMNNFRGYARRIGLKEIDSKYMNRVKKDFYKFYSEINIYIDKNLTGIKDGSIKNKKQIFWPKS